MTWLRGGPTPGWQRWLVAGAIGWLWSVPVGLALMLLALALKSALPAQAGLVMLFGAAGLFAPVYSWTGLLPALGLAFVLDRRGWFGWLPAAGTGLVCGWIAAEVIGGTSGWLTGGFGVISLLALRAALRIH